MVFRRAAARALIRRSVTLALQARAAFWAPAANRAGRLRPLVAAGIGPYGAYLADGSEYTGRYDLPPHALRAFHEERFRLLAESDADLLACETIPSAPEAAVLAELLGESTGAHAWISFSCRDGEHIADGTPLADAARAVVDTPGLVAIDRASRSTQPEPDEWCVDQCIQHMVVAYDFHMEKCTPVLQRATGHGARDRFERSWVSQRHAFRRLFDPDTKTNTLARTNPSDHFYPEAYQQFAERRAAFAAAVQQARSADLQARAWFLWITPINLGDYLELLVRHDELHIDQAQWALAAYRQFATA